MKLIKVLQTICLCASLIFVLSCSDKNVDVENSEAIEILNPSFESPATPNDSFVTSGPPTSWTSYGSINNSNRAVGVLNPNTSNIYLDPVPHGLPLSGVTSGLRL